MQKIKIDITKRELVEFELNNVKLRVYSSGIIFRNYGSSWLKVNLGARGCWIGDKYYLIHRIIFQAFNDTWNINDSKALVDHIDQDRSNNKISNLRAASHMQNGQNRGATKNSRSGIKCIAPYYYNSCNRWSWRIRVKENGRVHRREFIGGVGAIPDILPPIPQKVLDARNAMILEHHGEFACLD